MKKLRLVLVLCSLIAGSVACGSDDGQTPESSQSSNLSDDVRGSFAIALASTTPTVNLGETVSVDVTITPADGFVGTVSLDVAGLSTGVTSAPVSVAVSSGISTTVRLELVAAVTADVTPRDATIPITVKATSGAAETTASASFKVMPYLTIYIPRDIAALYQAPGGPLRAEWGEAFGPNNKPLRTQPGNPIVISIFNNDTKPHVLHGPTNAFPHGDLNNPIQPNSFEMKNGAVRTRTLKVGDSATPYVHGEPNSTNASFKVSVAATQ